MKLLIPTPITPAMLGAATSIAEPAAGETTWAASTAYALGDRRIRSTTHRVYECVQAHASRTALPEDDGMFWLDVGPTQRFAPFDAYVSTAAETTTALTYVISPGYVNAIALYGIVGTQISVMLKDAPGGAVVYGYVASLTEPAPDWYEYLFVAAKPINRLILSKLPIRPTAEITVTISAAIGAPVALGLLLAGDYRALVGDKAAFGGTLRGASAEPVTYSYINTADDGTTRIVRRNYATGMRANVLLPTKEADAALALIQQVLDIPVPWVATDAKGFDGLNVFGLGSGSLSYENAVTSNLEINVKGMI